MRLVRISTYTMVLLVAFSGRDRCLEGIHHCPRDDSTSLHKPVCDNGIEDDAVWLVRLSGSLPDQVKPRSVKRPMPKLMLTKIGSVRFGYGPYRYTKMDLWTKRDCSSLPEDNGKRPSEAPYR